MKNIAADKIDKRAINYIEGLIDLHNTMSYSFNTNDKELLWDGYIILPKEDNGKYSKDNFESRIPVQVKGHNDSTRKYFDNNKIRHSIDLNYLEGFGSEKGAIFFVVYLDDKGNGQAFYSLLYPSIISHYLEECRRESKNSITINMYRLEDDPQILYKLVKQFDLEAKKQGTIHSELVKDMIRIDEIKDVKTMNMEVVGLNNMFDVAKGLSEGTICMYGKTMDDKYNRPIEWKENGVFVFGSKVKQSVSVGDREYYQSFDSSCDSNGNVCFTVSNNLTLYLGNNQLKFDYSLPIKELYNDARFLIDLFEKKSININGNEIKLDYFELDDSFVERMNYIIDLNEVLEAVGIRINEKYSKLTEKQIKDLLVLVTFIRGKSEHNVPEGISKWIWNYNNKKVPLLATKHNNEISLQSSIYSENYSLYAPQIMEDGEVNERGYRMPSFMGEDENVLANLLEYKYDVFENQIKNMDFQPEASDHILSLALKMINIYDISKDIHFLEYAENIVDRLMEFEQSEILFLNKMQIKRRKNTINDVDLEQIKNMSSNDNGIEFGKNVLLGNKINAMAFFDKLKEEEKDEYKKFPIYTLYNEL